MFQRMVVVPFLVVMAVGCGKADTSKWPPRPADGAPLALEFVEMGKHKNGEPAARFRVYDYDEKSIRSFRGLMHYLDATGNELERMPASVSKARGIVEGKSTSEEMLGFHVPEATSRVTVDVTFVEFADGSTWEPPN
jgi:hypothetical protein